MHLIRFQSFCALGLASCFLSFALSNSVSEDIKEDSLVLESRASETDAIAAIAKAWREDPNRFGRPDRRKGAGSR